MHNFCYPFFMHLLFLFSTCKSNEKPEDILFILISQVHDLHATQAYVDKMKLSDQKGNALIALESFPDIATWTITPLVARLKDFAADVKWFILLHEGVDANVENIRKLLSEHDPSKDILLGRAIVDETGSITHHYDQSRLKYPDFAGGIAISSSLASHISKWWSDESGFDFSIDPIHEFVKFIRSKSPDFEMMHSAQFCTMSSGLDCATIYRSFPKNCEKVLPEAELLYAVKTCAQFHETRIPMLQRTWGNTVRNIRYYSHVEDPKIPTINVNIPNTERGHCGKTFYIFREFMKSQFTWLLLADDDTLLSDQRLRKLIGCYDDDQPIVLGERYGYGVTTGHGYDYITTGGGLAINRVAVQMLLDSKCGCSQDSDPDDMIIGMCFNRLAIPIIHNPLFHQARPLDYPADQLAHLESISFHRHFQVDPIDVYRDFLGGQVEAGTGSKSETMRAKARDEL